MPRARLLSIARRILLATATMAATAVGSTTLAQGNPRGTELAERLDPLLEKAVTDEKIPGLAVGIVEKGKLVYACGFGVLKRGESAPVTPETLFHMASVTKPFVATAVVQLSEQGKVDLDATVTKYVPYFRIKDPRGTSITVRQMLTHTSGMPDVESYEWDKPEYDDGALERYVRSLGEKELRWEPGSKFAYSNMAFEVLGDLVAKVSGMSFEDYVHAHILTPLGMKSSTLLLKEADPAKLAAGHDNGPDGTVTFIAHYPYNRAHSPSSNMHANVEDMARWMMANLNRGELDGRRILKDETYDMLWKPVAVAAGPKSVGISWFLQEMNGDPLVTHAGGDPGFSTFVALAPARKIGVVILMNTEQTSMRVRRAILAAALGWDSDPSAPAKQ